MPEGEAGAVGADEPSLTLDAERVEGQALRRHEDALVERGVLCRGDDVLACGRECAAGNDRGERGHQTDDDRGDQWPAASCAVRVHFGGPPERGVVDSPRYGRTHPTD